MMVPENDNPLRTLSVEEGIVPTRGAYVRRYIAALFAASFFVSGLAIALWSSMGMGQVALDWLQAHAWLWFPFTAVYVVILFVLLLLDFFMPPHLPGEYMRLWKTDFCFGRGLFVVAAVCFWCSCLFLADEYPSVPLVITLLLEPLLMAAIRFRLVKQILLRPAVDSATGPGSAAENKGQGVQRDLHRVTVVLAQEADAGRFYSSTMGAFASVAIASLAAWLVWVLGGERHVTLLSTKECSNGWLAPLECTGSFSYRGDTYDGCTMARNDVPWCAHSQEFSGTWSNCLKCNDSEVMAWSAVPATGCSLGMSLSRAYRAGLDLTEADCQQLCAYEPLCRFAVYYGAAGCTEPPCLGSDGAPRTRCGLATNCAISNASSSAAFTAFEKQMQSRVTITDKDKDELYILWSAPLVIAVSNFVFACFAASRVYFQRSYTATASQMILDSVSPAVLSRSDELVRVTAQQQEQAMRHLSIFVKMVVFAFIFIITLFWIAGQLFLAHSEVATMVLGLFGAFFLVFVFFTALSLKRVATYLWDSLASLPVWRTARALVRSDWTRAVVVCCGLPAIPVVVFLSMLNQCVRKSRGLYNNQSGAREEGGHDDALASCEDPRKLWVTPRMHQLICEARGWDKLSILFRCYVLCLLMFGYTTFPICLNVFLSWFSAFLQEMEIGFPVIVVITFFTGVAAFLLPPVPGLTVYVFGGIMMSSTCPQGFWAGAMVNIALGWFLKLVACAIQQKVIGGLLGKSLWVRQTCGVHKVAIRCIEAEMRRPGWTLGKVAILCGGPDWPVSVLAGILKLSLFQCELGTVPIIFFIIPCSLSGSFYMKRGTSELWTRSGNLMLVLSIVISGTLWVIAGWAMQRQLENNYAELTRPLPQNVDLEWLDYKAGQIAERVRVTWADVPCLVRYAYALGAFAHIMVCHTFYFGFSYLFNAFEVSDSVDDLQSWYGDEGIVTFLGCIALGVYVVGWFGPMVLRCWKAVATSGPIARAAEALDAAEAEWKAAWLEKARNWTPEDAKVKSEAPEEQASSAAPLGIADETGSQLRAAALPTDDVSSSAAEVEAEQTVLEGDEGTLCSQACFRPTHVSF